MVGAAAESIVLDVRDTLVARLQLMKITVPKDLTDWRIKRILDGIEGIVTSKKGEIPKALFERFDANWPAVTHQIRTVRNDAGHPINVEPVVPDEVHGSLLIFPQLAALASALKDWIGRTSF